jgi:23S rRNA (uracil1939-C5)-methyltransferase
MLFLGKNIKIEITAIAFGGNGVGRDRSGMTVFVPFTAPGDFVRVEITKVKKRFAEGKLIQIITSSEFRCEPKTENYTDSSISQYEHIVYAKQLEIKQEQLINQLTRIGKLDLSHTEILPIEPSPEIYHYRNKLSLHPTPLAEDYLGYGFYGHDNKTIQPILRCELADEKINDLIPKLNKMKWGKKNVTRPRPLDCTIRKTSRGETHAFFGRAPEKYPWLVEDINEFEVRVPLGSFFQVNIPVAEKLLRQVAKWVEQSGANAAIDAYCGVGVFGLHLPAEFPVYAFDLDESAVTAAQHNTLQAGLVNRRFYAGSDRKLFKEVIQDCDPSSTILIMDPPRVGCETNAIKLIAKTKFKAIIMVSCNPSTFARDLKILTESGLYQITKTKAYDMFPQTSHFEAVAMLELTK